RGLGAAVAIGACRAGAHVIATHSTEVAPAKALFDADVARVQADAGDPDAMRRVVGGIGPLGALVLCASPPISPLPIEEARAVRAVECIAQSVAMTAVPLACALPYLASGTTVVLTSSELVAGVPARFGHYVAAKSA